MTAVLWDLDDTLLDTLPARMRALSHAYERHVGGSVDPLELWRSHRGGTIEELGKRLLGEGYRDFVDTYRDHYFAEGIAPAPFPGIRETLGTLAAHGVPMAVVTSKVSWGATDELSRSGLLEYFGAVIGFDDTDVHKPEPDPVFLALERLVVDEPAATLFVGDSPADMRAGRSAGCVSVAAAWGTLEEGLLREAGPDYVARAPSEILQILSERFETEPTTQTNPGGLP